MSGVMISCSFGLLTITSSSKVKMMVLPLKLSWLAFGRDWIRIGGSSSFGPPVGEVCCAQEINNNIKHNKR